MSQSVRVFIPAFAAGIAVMIGLFYWMLETTSWFLLALSILGGAAIGLLVMLDNRRAANGTAFVPRLKLAFGVSAALLIMFVNGSRQLIDGVAGVAIVFALVALILALTIDIEYHLAPAAERSPLYRRLGVPFLIKKLSARWALRLLSLIIAVEIALVAVTQSYTFSPCSWLDLTHRLAGCVGVINVAESANDSAYAPNGKFVATADSEGVLRVWSLPARKLAYTLGDESEMAQASSRLDRLSLQLAIWVRFSPDSTVLASSAPDLKIRLWNVADGSLLRTLPASSDYVRALAFSPDGTILASASAANVIHLWRVQDGALLRTIEAPDLVHSLVFSPDGSLLLVAEVTDALHLWRVQDGTLVRTIDTEVLLGPAIFSPDSQLIAAEASQYQIGLWRVSDGTQVRTLGRHSDHIAALAFSPDGTLLASGAGLDDRDARLWRVSDGSLAQTIDLRFGADKLDFSADGSLLAIDSFRSLYFWRVR
ncbi:MAG TPA: WD40 repeat domain-containing protein [Herpetosiphonaceae bacterium]